MERNDIVAYLRGGPDLVGHACRGLTDDQLRQRPTSGEWSLIELLCHLRDSAIEEGMRTRRMVEEDNPTLEPYDEQTRALERNYMAEDPAKAATALRGYLTGYAYQLERFSEAEWERPGFHPESGPVTVRSRAELEVEHIAAHIEQMKATREAIVGP
ncbi:MAG TPA: DinB family protein [Dehalococcoidia bacterium]|nr:DinB family protein [Dehalococcoidia bacterium]